VCVCVFEIVCVCVRLREYEDGWVCEWVRVREFKCVCESARETESSMKIRPHLIIWGTGGARESFALQSNSSPFIFLILVRRSSWLQITGMFRKKKFWKSFFWKNKLNRCRDAAVFDICENCSDKKKFFFNITIHFSFFWHLPWKILSETISHEVTLFVCCHIIVIMFSIITCQ